MVTSDGVKAYEGPRANKFAKQFAQDTQPLRSLVAKRELDPGDFELVSQADGSKHDVLVKLGVSSYLVLNHTKKTIDELRGNPRWLYVQASIFNLSEKFRVSPLE